MNVFTLLQKFTFYVRYNIRTIIKFKQTLTTNFDYIRLTSTHNTHTLQITIIIINQKFDFVDAKIRIKWGKKSDVKISQIG